MQSRDRQVTLELARQGNALALGELLESFRPYIRAIVQPFCDRRLQARVDDSDLIQDALLEAHRCFAGFRGTTVAELAVWLRQIVIRSAGATLREFVATAKRDPTREQPVNDLAGLAGDASTPSAQAIRNEQTARMAEALVRLPPDMQRVVVARHVDGLAHAQIAELLGRSEAAVRVLYVRALARLRELCADG